MCLYEIISRLLFFPSFLRRDFYYYMLLLLLQPIFSNSKRNEQFFATGVSLMELWENCRHKLSTQQVPRKNRRQWQQQMDQLQQESDELRTSLLSVRRESGVLIHRDHTLFLFSREDHLILVCYVCLFSSSFSPFLCRPVSSMLQAYTGERLRRTMDWSWSAVADDVSSLTDRLTIWELRLFHAGATAVQNWELWQQQGKRRSVVRRVVTPIVTEPHVGEDDGSSTSPSKRQRVA